MEDMRVEHVHIYAPQGGRAPARKSSKLPTAHVQGRESESASAAFLFSAACKSCLCVSRVYVPNERSEEEEAACTPPNERAGRTEEHGGKN